MLHIKKQTRQIIFTLLLVSIFNTGCEKNNVQVHNPKNKTIEITNAENKKIGIGTHIKDNIFLTADHLLNKSENLYYKDAEIKVLARDFTHDLLLFKVFQMDHGLWLMDDRSNNISIDPQFFWHDGVRQQELIFLRRQDEVVIEHEIKKDVFIFSGSIEPGFSGSPFYDKKNHLQGILIGGNHDHNHVFGTGGSVFFDFIRENIDE